jgi:hypothetical protein
MAAAFRGGAIKEPVAGLDQLGNGAGAVNAVGIVELVQDGDLTSSGLLLVGGRTVGGCLSRVNRRSWGRPQSSLRQDGKGRVGFTVKQYPLAFPSILAR